MFAALAAPLFAPAQTPKSSAQSSSSNSPSAPMTPQEKMELQARIFMAKKQYADAGGIYLELATAHPRNAMYWNYLGITKQQLGDLTAAGKYYQRATKADKRFADGYSNLGTTWYARKDYKKAVASYKKAISVQSNVAGFYTNLGYAYFAEKQMPQAMEAFHQALAIDPAVFTQNDRNGGVMTYQSVADRGLFDFMLAKGFAQNGDVAQCAAYLKRAFEDGYKDVLKARTDPAFAKLLDDPGVKAALELAEPPPPPTAASASPSG
jgi:tetratricopeptide (TPR) repeat protein